MALTDENGMGTTMLVQPSGLNNGGFGGFGGDGTWLILFILLCCGGWGNGFGGGFGGYGNMQLGYDFPWLLNGQSNINANTNNGFRDAMLNDGITSVRDGISALSTQLCGCCGDMQMSLANGFAGVNNNLCNGFNGVNMSINGAQNALAQQMYTNQIADLERSFAAQTANTAGMNALQSQLANCCCENRAATADLKYTVATENCADRTAAMQNTRDIIEAQTRNTQAILDKLCQLELDGYKQQVEAKNDQIGQLRSQLQFANMQASQVDQTAQLRASQATTANQLVSELRSCPIPSQPVYGNTPIFTCNSNNGCGCGNFQ